MAQFDLLEWVSNGCPGGVYEGSSHRVSARGLHNRGFIRVVGKGKSWTAKITPEGVHCLKEQAKRVAVERERERRVEQAKAEREREQQELRTSAIEMLEATVAAGGRLDLGSGFSAQELTRIAEYLALEQLLPEWQRLAHEPTRMDPDLGLTTYLEPDFEALTPTRPFRVPQYLRDPHPAVAAFRGKRAYVSKPQIARAARFLQAMVSAATEVGWKVPAKVPDSRSGRDDVKPDLALDLPSQQIVVTVRELDQRGRVGSAFIEHIDHYTHAQRTVTNKAFSPSGRLEVTLAKVWEQQTILSLRDTSESALEDQLSILVHKLEVAEAEAQWGRQENDRRAQIREVRWEEVKAEAFSKLAYARNAERLRDELARRQATVSMRAYADEIDAHAASLEARENEAAREWADWIRRHAQHTDPLNGSLQILQVTTCSHDELQPYMNGWSTYHPYRQ
ncbi:hypothetical protein [Prescottella equi]|uniref:hypothetical protein n=1 Tax=Rhodococcus hoagii TaxID=43767 RepID=UPI0020C6FD92|nr:hypothetical protein [Prescottella equi]